MSNKEYRYYSAGEEGQYNVEENKGKLLELWGMEKQAVVERYAIFFKYLAVEVEKQ